MPERTCSIEGCDRDIRSRSLCDMHYQRVRSGGDMHAPPRIIGSPVERFWSKVDKRDGCWVWTGAMRSGYGNIRWDGKVAAAHRVAYELERGPIPDGLVIDHLCRNTSCVNPAHLEVVTRRENTIRGETRAAENVAKTHCPAGHPLAGENLYQSPGRPHRHCRECHRVNARARYHARKVQP